MQDASLTVDVGYVPCKDGICALSFIARTKGESVVRIGGSVEDEIVGLSLNSHYYYEFRRLLETLESTAKGLAGMRATLPWKRIDLPMFLEIRIGSIYFDSNFLGVSLRVDEKDQVRVDFYLSNDDDESILIYFDELQYRAFKKLLRSTEDTINTLISNRQASPGFLLQTRK